jgi:hypothetical protein
MGPGVDTRPYWGTTRELTGGTLALVRADAKSRHGEDASGHAAVEDRVAWRSPADAGWLIVDNVPPYRVSDGEVLVVAEGRRVVAYFHVESVDEVVVPNA